MKESPNSIIKRIPDLGKPLVAIIGAGFAGLEAARKLKGKDIEVLMSKSRFQRFIQH